MLDDKARPPYLFLFQSAVIMEDVVEELISQGHLEHSARIIAALRAQAEGNTKRFEEDAKRFEEDVKRFEEEARRFKEEARRFKEEAKRFKEDAKRVKEEAKAEIKQIKAMAASHVSFAEQAVLNAIRVLREHEDGCGRMLNQMLQLHQWMQVKIAAFKNDFAQEDYPDDNGRNGARAMVVGNDGTRYANGFHVGAEGGARDGAEVDRCDVKVSPETV
jgi:hypothetical protein